jgi:hypothetical protein
LLTAAAAILAPVAPPTVLADAAAAALLAPAAPPPVLAEATAAALLALAAPPPVLTKAATAALLAPAAPTPVLADAAAAALLAEVALSPVTTGRRHDFRGLRASRTAHPPFAKNAPWPNVTRDSRRLAANFASLARNGSPHLAKTDRVRYSPASAHVSYSQPYYTPRTLVCD